MEAKQITTYQCSKCNQYYLVKYAADSCCTKEAEPPARKPKLCECGAEIRYNGSDKCEQCIEKTRFSKAIHLNHDYVGQVYSEGLGWNDGYFESVDALVEWCQDEEVTIPDYAYACNNVKWNGIDIECEVENSLDGFYDDAIDDVVDLQELIDFVSIWNRKQRISTNEVNYKFAILLKEVIA
jgi:hypothetical protein